MTVEELWALYRTSNLLSPQKLADMGDFGESAKATLQRMLSGALDYEVFTWAEDQRLLAACTFARFTDDEYWLMHLASANDRRALQQVLAKLVRHAQVFPDGTWVTYRFRVENEAVYRLFASSSPCEYLSIEACYTAPPLGSPTREFRSECSVESVRVPASVGALQDAYSTQGLTRSRAVWKVVASDGPILAATLDVCPAWWNLSGLACSLDVSDVRTDASVPAVEAVRTLLAAAAHWFNGHGDQRWTIRVASTAEEVRTLLVENECTERPSYAQIRAPHNIALGLAQQYIYRLSLRRPPREVQACT